MKYLLLGDEHKTLFIEDDKQLYSIRYDFKSGEWRPGGNELFNNRVGFDSSEPIDSPYRYGNSSCMSQIVEISREEAEAFISKEINEKDADRLLNITNIMIENFIDQPTKKYLVTPQEAKTSIGGNADEFACQNIVFVEFVA